MTTENQQQSEVSKFLALLDQDHTEESDLNVIEALVYFHGKYQHVWMNNTLLGNDEGGEKFRRFLNSFRHGAIGKFFVAYIDALFQKHGIVSTVAFKTWVNQKNLQGATSHGASYFLGLGGETNNPGIRIKVNNAFNRLGSDSTPSTPFGSFRLTEEAGTNDIVSDGININNTVASDQHTPKPMGVFYDQTPPPPRGRGGTNNTRSGLHTGGSTIDINSNDYQSQTRRGRSTPGGFFNDSNRKNSHGEAENAHPNQGAVHSVVGSTMSTLSVGSVSRSSRKVLFRGASDVSTFELSSKEIMDLRALDDTNRDITTKRGIMKVMEQSRLDAVNFYKMKHQIEKGMNYKGRQQFEELVDSQMELAIAEEIDAMEKVNLIKKQIDAISPGVARKEAVERDLAAEDRRQIEAKCRKDLEDVNTKCRKDLEDVNTELASALSKIQLEQGQSTLVLSTGLQTAEDEVANIKEEKEDRLTLAKAHTIVTVTAYAALEMFFTLFAPGEAEDPELRERFGKKYEYLTKLQGLIEDEDMDALKVEVWGAETEMTDQV